MKSNSEKGVILFIDELRTIASKDRSNTDAGSLLKPIAAETCDVLEQQLRTIMTYDRKRSSLDRRFQQVLIKEPDLDLSLKS